MAREEPIALFYFLKYLPHLHFWTEYAQSAVKGLHKSLKSGWRPKLFMSTLADFCSYNERLNSVAAEG